MRRLNRRLTIPRVAGWLGALILSAVIVQMLLHAWIFKDNSRTFEQDVGWANIIGGAAGVAGLLYALLGSSLGRPANQELSATADKLSLAIRRSVGQQIGRLLGTDSLDSRAATVTFSRTSKLGTNRDLDAPPTSLGISDMIAHFLDAPGRRLAITGRDGSGKTVTLLHIVAELGRLRGRGHESMAGTAGSPVPVMLSFTSWPEEYNFEEWLIEELTSRFGLSPETSTLLVENGLILPVLDSLDEVDSHLGNRVPIMIDDLNRFLASNHDVRMIVACRDDSPRRKRFIRKLRGFEVWAVEPVSLANARAYVFQMCEEEGWNDWDDLFATADQTPFGEISSVPWRLAMAASYHANGGRVADLKPHEGGSSAEDSTSYINRVEPLLYREFVKARAKHYGQDPHRTLSQLRCIAVALVNKGPAGHVSDTIMLHEWWKWVDEISLWRHRAAVSFLAIQLPFGLYGHLSGILPDLPGPQSSQWLLALGLLVNYALLIAVTNVELRVKSAPRSTGLSLLRSATSRRVVLAGLIGVVAAAVLMFFGLDKGLAFGGATVLLIYAAISSTSGLRDLSTAQSPSSILRRDLIANLLLGAGFGIVQAFSVWDLLGGSVAICFALSYIVGSGATSAFSRYLAAAYISATRNGTPMRFHRYLQWASRAGLMRMSGVGFQFRHAGLQEYLISTHAHRVAEDFDRHARS